MLDSISTRNKCLLPVERCITNIAAVPANKYYAKRLAGIIYPASRELMPVHYKYSASNSKSDGDGMKLFVYDLKDSHLRYVCDYCLSAICNIHPVEMVNICLYSALIDIPIKSETSPPSHPMYAVLLYNIHDNHVNTCSCVLKP
jgi:hypothetical protein